MFVNMRRSSYIYIGLSLVTSSALADEMPAWLSHGATGAMISSVETNSSPAASSGGPYLEEYEVRSRFDRETVGERQVSETNGSTVGAEGPAGSDTVDMTSEERSRYLVQPSDVLVISVWREPDLLREVTVSPDGWVSFPLVGEVQVENQTLDQVREQIEARLENYINVPVVNVSLKQSLGNRVYVIGKVNSPGVFPFAKNIDVVQALSLAGGVSRFADENDIRVIRRSDDGQKTFRFRYSQIERGKNLEQNIILRSGDVVLVP